MGAAGVAVGKGRLSVASVLVAETGAGTRDRSLSIPWGIDGEGRARRAGDAALGRGLGCDCRCPTCGDRLVHRSGAVRRPHFAHHTKRPSESCLLGSALLAHQSGLLGLAGRVVDLPFPVDPMAAGAEPWLMDRRLAVESVELDVGFVLPDGDWQEVDAVLVGRDGRRVGVVVSTKGSATGGRTWMESVGLPTLKCRMDEAVAAGEAPSSADMLAGAVWLWEPYSAPLREAMAAHRAKERFRGLESQLAACAGLLDFAWQTAGEDPLGAHGTLRFVDDLLGETEPDDELQRDGWRRLKAQFVGVWDVAHRLVEDTLLDEYRDLVSKLGGGAGDELRPIEADRFGSTLRTNTRNLVNSRAQRIAGLGFRQAGFQGDVVRREAGALAGVRGLGQHAGESNVGGGLRTGDLRLSGVRRLPGAPGAVVAGGGRVAGGGGGPVPPALRG